MILLLKLNGAQLILPSNGLFGSFVQFRYLAIHFHAEYKQRIPVKFRNAYNTVWSWVTRGAFNSVFSVKFQAAENGRKRKTGSWATKEKNRERSTTVNEKRTEQNWCEVVLMPLVMPAKGKNSVSTALHHFLMISVFNRTKVFCFIFEVIQEKQFIIP